MPSPLIAPLRVKVPAVSKVKVRLASIVKVSLLVTFKVPDTVKSEACKVIVPLPSIVRLFKVLPPPVMLLELPDMLTVELPAVTVPDRTKFPPTVWVALARVIVPDRVKF